MHLAVIAQPLHPRKVATHGELPEAPVLAQETETTCDQAAAPVRGDDEARANLVLVSGAKGPHPRDPAAILDHGAGTDSLLHVDPGLASHAQERRVEGQASHRKAFARAAVGAGERRPVGRQHGHPQERLRSECLDRGGGAHLGEKPPSLGRDPFAADLVAGEAGLVDEHHVVAALAEQDRRSGARRPSPHDQDVAHPQASATATRR